MQFKNLQIVLTFVVFVSLALSSPIKDNTEGTNKSIEYIKVTEAVQSVDSVFKVTEFIGDDKVDAFLESGGADNDMDMALFVLNNFGYQNVTNVFFNTTGMACSAFQTPNEKGNGYYFGRNFDWMDSEPLVLVNHPDHGYSSISTVNTELINWAVENLPYEELEELATTHPEKMIKLPDDIVRIISIYAPLDGINEKGLSISINMVYNGPVDQNKSGLVNITSLPLIRVLLNKAATVDEAIEIIRNVNLHSSLDQDYHYLIADAYGNSVTVEYVNNEMEVIDTKLITNFYISKNVQAPGGGKDRYDIIQQKMDVYPNMNLENAIDTAKSVSRAYTQWSVIYDQLNLEAFYYIKTNYEKGYHIKLFEDASNSDSDDDTIVVDTEDLEEEENSDSDDDTIVVDTEDLEEEENSDSDDETDIEIM